VSVAVVRYNAGNIFSISAALTRLNVEFRVTDQPEEIVRADRVIFPGVGEASSAISFLHARELDDALRQVSAPLLGICLGLQLLATHSEENDTECLGLIETKVRRLTVARKVPHIGWSRVAHTGHPLFTDIPSGEFFYFVHSYAAEIGEATIAQCEYGELFSASIASKNRVGVQFHPEKSAKAGARLLRNFLRWNP
jgi:glutamine amidotransferase